MTWSTVASLYQRSRRPPTARGCGSRRASTRRCRCRRSFASATPASAHPSASSTTLNRGCTWRLLRVWSSLQHPQAGGRTPGAATALIPLCSGPSPPRSPPPSSVHASTFVCHLLWCLCSPLCTSTRLHPALPTLRHLLQRSSMLHSSSPQQRSLLKGHPCPLQICISHVVQCGDWGLKTRVTVFGSYES